MNKDKTQDDFIEFWERKKDILGLGNYSDEITQWWINWHTQSIKKILEGVVEHIGVEYKGMYRSHLDCPNEGDMYAGIGYREAKEDVVSHLQQIINSLEDK